MFGLFLMILGGGFFFIGLSITEWEDNKEARLLQTRLVAFGLGLLILGLLFTAWNI
jgi:hypothetical protein